jgi:hypothetical protein
MFLATGASAATLTVTSATDGTSGSLRDTIASASPGDEILFDASLAAVPIVIAAGEIVIDKDLTITGLGRDLTILNTPTLANPNDEHWFFVVRSGIRARFASLSMVNKNGNNFGSGGILNDGDLTLEDCAIDGFSSFRGAPNVNRGTLHVVDSAFRNNRNDTPAHGGALSNEGLLYIRRSSFSNNWAYDGGGAIANFGYVEAEECLFERNRTFRLGGAILNGGAFHLSRSIVRDNYALYGGGGVVGGGGGLSIVESTFTNNTIGTRASYGGALIAGTSTILKNSTVHRNGVQDTGGHGAGIYNPASARIVLVNTTVTGNYLGSNGYGGAAGVENSGEAVLRGSLIAGNYAPLDPYCSPPIPGEVLSSDWQGAMTSLGHNFVGGCTAADLYSCSQPAACGGLVAQDRVGVAIEDVVETVPSQDPPALRALLAANGGPTPTVALLPESPAIDDIPPGECVDDGGSPLLTDQRGTSKPQGPGCDVGSFEFALPRGSGFWAHQCSGLGYAQLTPDEMQTLFDQVAAASPAFPECMPAGCEVLQAGTRGNDMREKAERDLLGLWLNVVTGRVTRGCPIDMPDLTSAANVGDALAELEVTVCDADASHGDLGASKDVAEAINNMGEDMELVAVEPSAVVQPGSSRSFTLAVVNMTDEVRSYDLTSQATWPVTLSLTRIHGLGPGQVALVTATLSAIGASAGQAGVVRVTASDRGSEAPLERTAAIRILVSDPRGPGGGRRIPRVE